MNQAIDKLPQHEKKRKKPETTTGKTLEHFHDLGIPAGVVERRIPYTFITLDLFGFIDVVACIPPTNDIVNGRIVRDPGHILAVQVTSDAHVAERVKKIVEDCPHARDWLESGGRIVVHGWGKKGAAGKRKLWTLRTVQVTLADLPSVEPPSCSPSGGTGRG